MDRSEWVLVPMYPPQMALDYLHVPEICNWHGMLSLMPVPPKWQLTPPAEQAENKNVEMVYSKSIGGDQASGDALSEAIRLLNEAGYHDAADALSQRPVKMPSKRDLAEQLCEARNQWAEKHEAGWLETDDNHPDDWIAGFLHDYIATRTSP